MPAYNARKSGTEEVRRTAHCWYTQQQAAVVYRPVYGIYVVPGTFTTTDARTAVVCVVYYSVRRTAVPSFLVHNVALMYEFCQ